MDRRAAVLLSLLTVVGVVGVGGGARPVRAETPIPPPPARWVTDRAAFLSPAAAATLDARLGDYARVTGHQVLVYIDHTTGGVPIEDWGVRAFERWRVGRRGIDDGVAIFVFADDHRLRIEVGYGLEGALPDVTAKRIIEERVVPRIRAGDRDGAIRAGVDAVIAALGGAAQGDAGRAGGSAADQVGGPLGDHAVDPGAAGPPPAPIPGWMRIVGGVLLVLAIGFLVTHPSLAWLLLLSIGSGRGGGGGWRGGGGGGGGGGGFSGGGGGSGGGGASGSW